MNKSTPTKKKPIKAHRGRIIYEGRGRPIGGGRPQIPRPFPGRPRPFPGRPMPRPMPFPPPRGRRRPPTRDPRKIFGRPVPPRRGPQIDQRRRFDMAMRARVDAENRRRAAEFNNMQVSEPITQRARMGNKGMSVTKKAIGENDFRKGGLTLSTVDNRKNK